MSLFPTQRIPVWIDPHTSDADPFPDVERALRVPDGLLAIGGHLQPPLLLTAYRRGLFPWFPPGEPIHWWSPDPRYVLYPDRLRISRSLRRTIRRETFSVTCDRAFDDVVAGCAAPRDDEGGTWIGAAMYDAYVRLHRLGFAHSVEAWQEGRLVGGLYGVAIGRIFFGESMFHRETDASKVCLAHLCRRLSKWNYELIDCQVRTGHLVSLGAEPMPRRDYVTLLDRSCTEPPAPEAWRGPEAGAF